MNNKNLNHCCAWLILSTLMWANPLFGEPDKPSWYGNLPPESGHIIGYGNGKSLQEAKRNALSEISQAIEVTVEGSSKQVTQSDDDGVSHEARREITLSTRQKLRNVSMIKKDTIDDHIFAAYKLDIRPSEIRIAEDLQQKWNTVPQLKWSGPSWLVGSSFIRELSRNLHKGGTAASAGSKKASVKLHRNNQQWVLLINNEAYFIWPEDLERLFAWGNSKPDSFSLKLVNKQGNSLPRRLKEGDKFLLTLENEHKLPGYYTLFNIYPDGRIVLMQESKPLKKTNEFPPPDMQKKGYVLSAQPATPGQEGIDVFMATRTQKRLDTLEFKEVQDIIATGESSYKLHKLLAFLTRVNPQDIATIRVKITPM